MRAGWLKKQFNIVRRPPEAFRSKKEFVAPTRQQMRLVESKPIVLPVVIIMKLVRRFVFAVTSALFFLLVNALCAAESADDLVEKGKVFERKFEAREALPLYLAAEKLEPQNCHILVRI